MQARHRSPGVYKQTSLVKAPRPIQRWVCVKKDETFGAFQRAVDAFSPILPRFGIFRAKDIGAWDDLGQGASECVSLRCVFVHMAEEYIGHRSTLFTELVTVT
jgi:hypothetical protein